ncbi:hypothetical protein [Spiroplasma endosymbiont of Panzeria rudis]|uniref:hypothetical protein n=1 Tax=Spiroplasma endosymbiont of Panzeria rudis TaxID=3066301 RepID=UPI0030D0FA3B
MNNYLLSVDPSIKNTGFTLWENKKPIWINSYSFKNYNYDWKKIQKQISYLIDMNKYNLLMERGTFHSKNGIGYETQEHLRGFIAGTFNKLLTKDMLISPSSWKKWYIDNNITNISLKNWNKKISEDICFYLNEKYEWNININNHDEADSLLIGWYYLNKEVK